MIGWYRNLQAPQASSDQCTAPWFESVEGAYFIIAGHIVVLNRVGKKQSLRPQRVLRSLKRLSSHHRLPCSNKERRAFGLAEFSSKPHGNCKHAKVDLELYRIRRDMEGHKLKLDVFAFCSVIKHWSNSLGRNVVCTSPLQSTTEGHHGSSSNRNRKESLREATCSSCLSDLFSYAI